MRELDYPTYAMSSAAGPRLRWSSIFAGCVMWLATMACLGLLGAGIGFMAAPNGGAGADATSLGIIGAAYLAACGIVSAFVGSWVASRLTDSGRAADGVIYGLVCWATTTLVSVLLIGGAAGGLFASEALTRASAFSTAGIMGLYGFGLMVVEAIAAALGGRAGARLYVPVPVSEFRRHGRGSLRQREVIER